MVSWALFPSQSESPGQLRIVDLVSAAALSVYLGPFRFRGWVNRADGL